MNKVKRYIEVCHICLKTKPKYKKNRPVYGGIPVDYAPMQDLSIDIKMMSQAFDGYWMYINVYMYIYIYMYYIGCIYVYIYV